MTDPRCHDCGHYKPRPDLDIRPSMRAMWGDCLAGHGCRPRMTGYRWAACAVLVGTVSGLRQAGRCDDYLPPQGVLF